MAWRVTTAPQMTDAKVGAALQLHIDIVLGAKDRSLMASTAL